MVYGANEAGKSTAFMAWLDFLFGFQGASPYAFRFDRRELMVGAELETPDGPQLLRRSTATAGSLTDANGHLVADQRMAGWLFGLDREAYRTRFSLNDAILREGGEEIAQAQGDLGQLLHAGASGLSGLSDALAKIEGEVDAFHKKGGRKTVANEGRNRLKELEAELRNVRLDPRSYDRLSKERDDAEAAFAEAQEALADARRALKLREAADVRRGVAREIEALRDQLETMPAGPDLPSDAVARVASAAQRRAARGGEGGEGAGCRRGRAGEAGDPRRRSGRSDRGRAARGPRGGRVRRGRAAVGAGADRACGPGEAAGGAPGDPGADGGARGEVGGTGRRSRGGRPAAGTDRGPPARGRRGSDRARHGRGGDQGAAGGRGGPRRGGRAAGGPRPAGGGAHAWHRLPDALDDALRVARDAAEALAADTVGLPANWRATAEAGFRRSRRSRR